MTTGVVTGESARPGDQDGDGVGDAVDLCPKQAEDRDGFEDEDGCPDPDNDKDRISDANDKCPDEPESYNGYSDEDGCPDKGRVVVHMGRIEILDKIYFKTNSAEVKPISTPILDAIAATLKGNPQIEAIEVHGPRLSGGGGHLGALGPARRASAGLGAKELGMRTEAAGRAPTARPGR